MKKYYLRYRYKKFSVWGISDEWKYKNYTATDKNDLIEKINRSIREYGEFYIIEMYEIKEKYE